MNPVTITLTHRQATFVAQWIADGIDGYIFHDIPRENSPVSILTAWRKESVLWKKDPFRGCGNDPRTRKRAREQEAVRLHVDLNARILTRVIAALALAEGGAA